MLEKVNLFSKLPCVCLTGHVTLFPDTFLADNMPPTSKAVDNKMKDQAAQQRSTWLSSKAQAIPRCSFSCYCCQRMDFVMEIF